MRLVVALLSVVALAFAAPAAADIGDYQCSVATRTTAGSALELVRGYSSQLNTTGGGERFAGPWYTAST